MVFDLKAEKVSEKNSLKDIKVVKIPQNINIYRVVVAHSKLWI